jgi:hypothetical protein
MHKLSQRAPRSLCSINLHIKQLAGKRNTRIANLVPNMEEQYRQNESLICTKSKKFFIFSQWNDQLSETLPGLLSETRHLPFLIKNHRE